MPTVSSVNVVLLSSRGARFRTVREPLPNWLFVSDDGRVCINAPTLTRMMSAWAAASQELRAYRRTDEYSYVEQEGF